MEDDLTEQEMEQELIERKQLMAMLDTPIITYKGMYSILDEYNHDDNTPASLGIDVNNLDITKFNAMLKDANAKKNKHNSTIDEILVDGLVRHIRESNDFPESIEDDIKNCPQRITDFKKSSAILRDAIRKSGKRSMRIISDDETHEVVQSEFYF